MKAGRAVPSSCCASDPRASQAPKKDAKSTAEGGTLKKLGAIGRSRGSVHGRQKEKEKEKEIEKNGTVQPGDG